MANQLAEGEVALMSLAGGMDLSKLKSASTSSEVSTLRVANLVVAVTEKSLPSVVTISKSAPVFLEFYQEAPDSNLEQAIRNRSGAVLLGRIDAAAEPRVAQAFGVQKLPSQFALIQGKPVQIFDGSLSPEQIEAVLDQLIEGAKAQGVSGKLVEGELADAVPTLSAPLQEALALVDSGEVDQAFDKLTKLKAENPKDLPTSALLAQVTLMKRTMNLEHERILESQPTNFAEALTLADVLAAIGDFPNAFELMLSLWSQVSVEEQDQIKSRLLEYFEIAGGNNDSVKSARARLATLIY